MPGFDFPTSPATGTVVTVPDGSYRVWDSQKWRASPSGASIYPPGTGFLPLTGATPMTGPLTLSGNATLPLHAVPLQQLNTAFAGWEINALSLGFVGDGTADNTSQMAALFARTDSATIRFAPGVYVLSPPTAQLLAASNISIVGSGRNNTIFRYPANTAPTTHLYSWNTRTGFVLRDFTLDLNGMRSPGGRTGTHGTVLSFAKCNYWSMDSVAIINGFGDGGVTDNTMSLTHVTISTSTATSSSFTIRNCLFTLLAPTFAFGRAIGMSEASGFPITGGRFKDNICINTNGIQIDGSYHVVDGNELNGGWCSLDDTPGWLAGHADDGHTIYSNNHIHDGALGVNGDGVPSAGFTVSGNQCTYRNNVVERMGGPGFILFGNNATLSDNRVVGCGRNTPPRGAYDQAGYRMPAGTPDGLWNYGANTKLMNNVCLDDGGGTMLYGYYEMGDIPGVTLSGNDFNGVVTAPMIIASATTVVDGGNRASASFVGLAAFSTSSPTQVMAGLNTASSGPGVTITPKSSGILDIRMVFNARNNTVSDGMNLRIRYGTGTPPVAGAAVAGSGSGSGVQSINGAGGTPTIPTTLLSAISGLIRGTTYWIDIGVTAVTGGTVTINGIDVLVTER